MRARSRVAVYVLDPLPASDESRVLCFDHADFPAAGTQIPAGGVAEGETVEAAAARKVLEETGIRIGRTARWGFRCWRIRSAGFVR